MKAILARIGHACRWARGAALAQRGGDTIAMRDGSTIVTVGGGCLVQYGAPRRAHQQCHAAAAMTTSRQADRMHVGRRSWWWRPWRRPGYGGGAGYGGGPAYGGGRWRTMPAAPGRIRAAARPWD